MPLGGGGDADHGGPVLEYLVVDGGSTDGTVDLIRAQAGRIAWWCSEPDRGISHAFNKGLARARGRYIAILNADDRYTPGALARAVAALEAEPGADFCFGHCRHTSADAAPWLNLGNARYQRGILARMPDVNHPTWLVRRTAYQRTGGYDEGLRLAMDYDLLLRLHRQGSRGLLVDAIQAEMAMGGRSDRQWEAAVDEVRRISVRHGADPLAARIRAGFYLLRGRVRRRLAAAGALDLVDRIRAAGRRRAFTRT